MDNKDVLVKIEGQVARMLGSTESLLDAVDLQQAHLVELAATIREAIARMDEMRQDGPGAGGTSH